MATDRVDFIDEDDAGRILLGLLEHVAHAARTDAHEHLDEVRPRDRKERHVGFACDRARQQRLTGAGRPHQQYSARNTPAQPPDLAGIRQEFYNLLPTLLAL